MLVNDFITAINNGTAKVLTVEAAKSLKGKKIYWFYFGYEHNAAQVYELVVGDIVTEIDYYSNEPVKGWASRADEWRATMTPEKLKEVTENLLLLDNNGNNTYIISHNDHHFDERTFTCSDADRCVYFIECESCE